MANFFKKIFGGGFSASKISDSFEKDFSPTQPGKCRYCGKSVIWKDIKTGQRWPLNPKKMHCVDDDGNVFLAYVPHFETCHKWRKSEEKNK